MADLNSAVLVKRDEISKISSKLALAEFALEKDNSAPQQILTLQNRLATLKEEVGDIAQQKLKVDYSPEGLVSDELLSNWLKAVILLEESQSRLSVIKQRKKEFETIYSQFAPWGSRLKKIEREIALAEDLDADHAVGGVLQLVDVLGIERRVEAAAHGVLVNDVEFQLRTQS